MIGNYYKLKKQCNINDTALFLIPQMKNFINAKNRSALNHICDYGLINAYCKDTVNDPNGSYNHHIFLLFDKEKIKFVDEPLKKPFNKGTTIVSYLDHFLDSKECVETYEVQDNYIMVVLDLYLLGVSEIDLEKYYYSVFSSTSKNFGDTYAQNTKYSPYQTDYSGVIMYHVMKKTETLLYYLMEELNVHSSYFEELHSKIILDEFTGEINPIDYYRFQAELIYIFEDLKKVDKKIEEEKKQNKQ